MDVRLGVNQLPGGEVEVNLTGVDWQRYALLGSPDMKHWSTNTLPITMAQGLHHFTNSMATNGPILFYKAAQTP